MFRRKLPSYAEGTLVGGNFPTEEFKTITEETNAAISTQVDGFFNSIPAKYNLHVLPTRDCDFLVLNEEFVGDVRPYLKGFPERTIRTYERYRPSTKSAFLFPHHNLVFVFNGWRFENLNNQCNLQKRLEKIGYSIVFKRKKTSRGKDLYSEIWNTENMNEFLMMLRDTDNGFDAADKRAKQIVDLVDSGVDTESYTYAEFIPKHWVSHVYDEDELEISPVKRLIAVPAKWRTSQLEILCKGLPLTRAIGLTSKVKTKNGEMHIPMIDFQNMEGFSGACETDGRVDHALEKLGMDGIVVASGASYHFYGSKPLTNSQWTCFMEVLEEAIPYVDENWPKLQLKQGYSMLRLTPSRRKFTQPCYLRHFHPKSTGTDQNSASEDETSSLHSELVAA